MTFINNLLLNVDVIYSFKRFELDVPSLSEYIFSQAELLLTKLIENTPNYLEL